MTPLALRTSGSPTASPSCTATASRRMWRGIWPRAARSTRSRSRSITNGIHPPTWLRREMHELLRPLPRARACASVPSDPAVWEQADTIPAGELWRSHELRRERLVLFARERLRRQLPARARAASPAAPPTTRSTPTRSPSASPAASPRTSGPTCSSATRTASRASSTTSDRPVQIIFAGKAHPLDDPGKDLIRQIVQDVAAPRPARPDRVPRGLRHARRALPGAGRRRLAQRARAAPWRPRGTSGMKAAVNGALNLSVLDGWWARATAGLRLGHRQRRAVRRPGGERRRRGRGALHAARERGHPGLLRARLVGPAPGVDHHDDGVDPQPGRRVQHRPHGARLRPARLHPAPTGPRSPWRPSPARASRRWRTGASACARPGPG